MKLKKTAAAFTLAVCAASAIGMAGCVATDTEKNTVDEKYTVTVKKANSDDSYILTAEKGEKITMNMLFEAYPEKFLEDTGFFLDKNLYTDEACLAKFSGGVDRNITLYFGMYAPSEYGRVVFEYNDEKYTVFRAIGSTLTAADFSLSAYGHGDPADYEFYSDESHTSPLSLDKTEVKSILSGDTIVYVAEAV